MLHLLKSGATILYLSDLSAPGKKGSEHCGDRGIQLFIWLKDMQVLLEGEELSRR